MKVALVTAASKGMGAACAKELAANDYRVALLARSTDVEQLAKTLGGTATVGSVTNPDDLERLVESTLDHYGRIDAVVNNTGHPAKGPLLELTDEDWHAGMDLLLLNIVRLARLVTPAMQQQGGGAFVNISTFGAVEPDAAFPISSAIRAAVAAFTKLFAKEFASASIRMNSVLPGFIESYPVSGETIQRIPMGRPGTVDEIAKTVAFLLSDDASYITGQNIRVDGGLVGAL